MFLGFMTVVTVLCVSATSPACVTDDTDYHIVRHLSAVGYEINSPKLVSFRVFVTNLDELVTIQTRLRNMGMAVTVYDRPDGRTLVNGEIKMPLDSTRLSRIRCELVAFLEDHSAYYEGWGTGFHNTTNP